MPNLSIIDKINSYALYNGNKELLGIGEIELPELATMTDTLKGAGIAGEIDTPTVGQYQSATFKITFNTMNNRSINLSSPTKKHFDARADAQSFNNITGEFEHLPIKIILEGIPKTMSLGKFNTAEKTETGLEYELLYMKMWINNEVVLEIDKFNFICKIDGIDYLSEVRKNLGK